MATKLAKKCMSCGREFSQEAVFCPFDGSGLTIATPPSGAHTGLILDRRYRLVELIGRGGMGTVYKAVHLELNRAVAVKVLNGELINDSVAIQRFRREAKALGRISHPNAVNVSDFGVTPEGLAYIVMELLQGQNLRTVIASESPLGLQRTSRIMRQVAAAVGAAHVEGIIHRDLKPDNVVLIGSGSGEIAKVLDFGIAKLRSTTGGLTNTLTGRDAVVGTPQYMSPEACQGHELTTATDVYALGIIAFELLTGRVPFDAASSIEVAIQQVNEPPPRLTAIRDDVGEEIEAVVLRALSKDPRFRQATAGDLGEQLEAAVRATLQIRSRITSPMVGPTFEEFAADAWRARQQQQQQQRPVAAAPVAQQPDGALPLRPVAVAALAALGAFLGLIVAGAAIYFLVPPPTPSTPQTIETSGGGEAADQAEPAQTDESSGDTQ